MTDVAGWALLFFVLYLGMVGGGTLQGHGRVRRQAQAQRPQRRQALDPLSFDEAPKAAMKGLADKLVPAKGAKAKKGPKPRT